MTLRSRNMYLFIDINGIELESLRMRCSQMKSSNQV